LDKRFLSWLNLIVVFTFFNRTVFCGFFDQNFCVKFYFLTKICRYFLLVEILIFGWIFCFFGQYFYTRTGLVSQTLACPVQWAFASFGPDWVISVPIFDFISVSVIPPRHLWKNISGTIIYNLLFAGFRNFDQWNNFVKLVFI